MTRAKPKSKAQLAVDARHAFVRAVCDVLEIVGARCVEPCPPCPTAKGPLKKGFGPSVSGGRWKLDLEGTTLRIAPYENWIACQFEEPPTGLVLAAVERHGQSLNPYSFKWNWHYGSNPGSVEAKSFGHVLCSLMPLDRAAPLVERLNAQKETST